MSFGKTVGQLEMLLSTFPFREISSRTWQKEFHLGFSTKMGAKDKSLAAFYRINPDYPRSKKRLDDNLVDAFLIAYYGLFSSRVRTKGAWNFEQI
jgi:hypothetical protein